MGKKERNSQNDQNSKSKPVKPNKAKNKQMFAELKTHEQTKMGKFNRTDPAQLPISQQMVNQDQQNSYDCNEQAQIMKDQDIEQLCAVVHQLIEKKKLTTKNAFDVPFIDLERLEEFQNITQSQNGWKRISSTLENDSKIYSCRVDAIHLIAYKIMNTMTRNQDEPPQQNQPMVESAKQSQIDKVSIPMVEQFDIQLRLQLEKNIQNINMQSLDKLSQYNPTYERTRRRFDQNGLRGMLLNNVQLDQNIQLCLNQTRKTKSSGFYAKPTPVEVGKLTQQPEIFRNIENTRKNISELIKQEFKISSGFDQAWRKVKNGDFAFEKDDVDNSNEMDIEVNEDKIEPSIYKKVQDVIKIKTKNKLSLKTVNDVAQDGLSWLTDMDKKMLGINAPSLNPTVKKQTSLKTQRNQDDIQFDISSKLYRKDVFSNETMEKQKQEYNEEVQEKHLLPLRLFHKFKVEQIMTLREEPEEVLMNNMAEMQQEMHEKEIEQVDIRRQQMSIRESKQKLKSMVLKETDFRSLCRKFQIAQRNIAPELCFLTVLHLANENNLRLEQVDDYNFKIKS